MEEKINEQQSIQQPIVKQKKSRWWVWVLVIIILIVVGLGIWFLFFGGNEGGSIIGGSSLPKPPALPD